MKKLIKELTDKKRKGLVNLLKQYFDVQDFKNRIEFKKGFRTFTIYSLDLNDPEFGLSSDIDLDTFLESNFYKKTKHTKSLQDKLYNKKMNFEQACAHLNWKILDGHDSSTLNLIEFTEDPIAEIIFELSIKDKTHIIIDDTVYEGEGKCIKSLSSQTAIETLRTIGGDKLINDILSFND